jgi:hypothetical protein
MTTRREIHVRMQIPVAVEHCVPVPNLIFTRWLPIAEQDSIECRKGRVRIRLWFDDTVAGRAVQESIDDLHKWNNPGAHFVWADAWVEDVPAELAEYIYSREYRESPYGTNPALEENFRGVGNEIAEATIHAYNLLISHVRSFKGQYWLNEYEYDSDRSRATLQYFSAKTINSKQEWIPFLPGSDVINVELMDDNRFITQADWEIIKEGVLSGRKPSLVGILLSGAEELMARGQSRSAITEAVTALEVALYKFASSPNAERLANSGSEFRRDLSGIKPRIDRLGLTTSVAYLLPILLPSDILPDDVLKDVGDAISARQNVVHNGQRQVALNDLARYMKGIRSICETLQSFSIKELFDV